MPAASTRGARKRRIRIAKLPLASVATRPRRDPRKVLLALDGSRASNAALRFARTMASLGAWSPHAITVTPPLPTFVGEFVLPASPLTQEAIQNSVLMHLRTQLRRFGLPAWPTNVRFGPTGWSILETAHELGAQLIVIGLGKHGKVARLFGAETANKVVRRSNLPVLAVHPSTHGLPRVAVVAMDFGEPSLAAARGALEILEPGGELHLVHVAGNFNSTSMANNAWNVSYADAVEAQFVRVTETLERITARQVKTKLLRGDVVGAVTTYARTVRADLLAAGSHNQGMVERVLLGSTTAELLRAASCSVLIAPTVSPAGA